MLKTRKRKVREVEYTELRKEEKGRGVRFLNWKYLLVIICILFVSTCGGFAQKNNEQIADHVNKEIGNKDYSKLLYKAQTAGSIRIIVRLNMPFIPEGQLSTNQETVKQQVRISNMQNQLCEAFSKYNAKEIKRFKYTPYIVIEVDSTALKVVISNPLVMSIEEDDIVPPT